MQRAAFENAIRANTAIGGSTNAIIHLMAIAGRLGVALSLDDFDELARPVPTLVDLLPSGRHLMEDFCYAGGLPVVLQELAEAGMLNRSQMTVTGPEHRGKRGRGDLLGPRSGPHRQRAVHARRTGARRCSGATCARTGR